MENIISDYLNPFWIWLSGIAMQGKEIFLNAWSNGWMFVSEHPEQTLYALVALLIIFMLYFIVVSKMDTYKYEVKKLKNDLLNAVSAYNALEVKYKAKVKQLSEELKEQKTVNYHKVIEAVDKSASIPLKKKGEILLPDTDNIPEINDNDFFDFEENLVASEKEEPEYVLASESEENENYSTNLGASKNARPKYLKRKKKEVGKNKGLKLSSLF